MEFRHGCHGLKETVDPSLCAVQIIDPHDKGIAESILANLDPKKWDADSVLSDPLCVDRTGEMIEGYFDHIASLTQHK